GSDDRGWAVGERFLAGVADLVGVLDVVAGGAEEPRELVVARVADVTADVAPAIEVLLIGLLRSPAVVVHHDRHDPDAVPYRGLELLGVHQAAAAAVDRDDRRLRATELGAQRHGEAEAEAPEIQRRG